MSVMCSARVPVGPGAVRAALCKPAKGRSQSSPGGGGVGLQQRVTVGPPREEVGGSSLGPGEVLFLLERRHQRDEARAGLAIGANSSRSASAVGA